MHPGLCALMQHPGLCPPIPTAEFPQTSLHDPPALAAPLQRYARALVVLPYVSIVNEKAEHLARVLAPMGASVKGYFGTEESGSALAPRCAGEGGDPWCARQGIKKCNVMQGAAASAATVCVGLQFCTLFSGEAAAWCACALDAQV